MILRDLFYILDNLNVDSQIWVWDNEEDYHDMVDVAIHGRYFTLPDRIKHETVIYCRVMGNGDLHVLI